jgi:hypothetical protein
MWLLVVDEGYERRIYEHESEELAMQDYNEEIQQAKIDKIDKKIYLSEVKLCEDFEGE